MGQARNRGTFEERRLAAIQRDQEEAVRKQNLAAEIEVKRQRAKEDVDQDPNLSHAQKLGTKAAIDMNADRMHRANGTVNPYSSRSVLSNVALLAAAAGAMQ